MKYCSNCGTPIPDGTKFCQECGQKVIVSVEPAAEIPKQVFTQPVQPENGGTYVPPEPPEKEKKPVNKKIFLFAGIGAAVILLIVILALCLRKGGSKDPNLGRYEGVSCTVGGIELGAEGDWIELKEKGKADICIFNETASATWELSGEKFTLSETGAKYEGTLKDGILTIDFDGMVYVFRKEGSAPAETSEAAETAKEAGYWTLLRVDSNNADEAMDEELVSMFKEMGVEFFIDLSDDGTAVVVIDEPVKGTWKDGRIILEDGLELAYVLTDDLLHLDVEGADYVFTRGEGSAPDINWSSQGGATGPSENESEYAWWDGKWYGWLVFSDASDYYTDWIDSCGDCIAMIDVYDDDTGYVELSYLDGENFGYVDVSFGPGTTENGCMMSEEGTFMDLEISHADWIVDPGASVVSEFEHMIHIDGTVYDSDGDWLDYEIFLRPWGMDWEDVRVADTSRMMYEDMMPMEYDSWYLPQLENGAPVSNGNSDGFSGFDGPTDIFDYNNEGELFFEYPLDRFAFDNSFGIDTLETSDYSLRMLFSADKDEYDREGSLNYLDACADFEDYQREELTIGGFDAIRVTYSDEFDDASASVYIDFGENAGTYLGIRVDIYADSRELRDSSDVQNVLNSIQVNWN